MHEYGLRMSPSQIHKHSKRQENRPLRVATPVCDADSKAIHGVFHVAVETKSELRLGDRGGQVTGFMTETERNYRTLKRFVKHNNRNVYYEIYCVCNKHFLSLPSYLLALQNDVTLASQKKKFSALC